MRGGRIDGKALVLHQHGEARRFLKFDDEHTRTDGVG